MTPDDMARDLRAAGWEPYLPESGLRMWRDPNARDAVHFEEIAWTKLKMHELARQRKAGTVVEPVVGQEEKT